MKLSRNRDFLLLQSGQLLSSAGSQATSIAYPLLVLALTGSAAKAGVVAFARTAPFALLALPAGMAADRYGRRRLMVASDVVRAVVIGALGALVATNNAEFWMIPCIAVVEGAGAALFAAAEVGALRAVVPVEHLPPAVSAQTGRRASVQLLAPPLGGALFGVARSLPFIVDGLSYSLSTASLLAMRTPFEEERVLDPAPLRTRAAQGLRFLWQQPFLRTSALVFGISNFIGPGLLFSIVVIGRRHGLSAAAIGCLIAAFGASLVLGSTVSGIIRSRLPARRVLVLELWAWVGCSAFVVWPSVYVLAAGVLPAALVIASTDSVVHGYRLAITPDRILGRSESVRSMISLSIAPLGPLAAGLLLGVSERLTIGLFAIAALALAVWGTLSPSLRGVSAQSLAIRPESADRSGRTRR